MRVNQSVDLSLSGRPALTNDLSGLKNAANLSPVKLKGLPKLSQTAASPRGQETYRGSPNASPRSPVDVRQSRNTSFNVRTEAKNHLANSQALP
jgi:hypothetical protein